MHDIRPGPGLLAAAVEMIREVWENRQQGLVRHVEEVRVTLRTVERKIENLIDRVAEAEGPGLIKAYEKQIRKLEQERLMLMGKAAAKDVPQKTFDQGLRTALTFLANPWKLYVSEVLEDKRLALRLVFGGPISYDRNEGFRTANLSLPFKALGQFLNVGEDLVELSGIEPLTSSLRTTRSPN